MGGAFNPAPRRFGAEAGELEEVLLDDLLDADGSALAKDVDAYVWAEHLAESRCLAYLHHLTARFASQWDPARMTDFLPRWERILGLIPLPTATPVERRAAVGAKVALYGVKATYQVVRDLVAGILGPVFVQLVITPSTVATGYVAGGASVPGGVTLADATAEGITWYSTIAHLVVLVQQPATYDDATFYATVGQLGQWLDDLLPAWVTWDWVRDGAGGAGFILDDPHNLDNERFDT